MSLEDTITKLSLYDAKKYFRKAQNVVFNYTEMEAKVREATNNEPWGASSTLMEYIAQGTYNFREREEILGMIFRRFTEKTASEWRQIYKALQLLEYLMKHGSERFIDDVRLNLNLVKMLESFHYIDSQARDQGINVRNRATQLVKLLENDEQIRQDRKKARETLKKYKGVPGGTAAAAGMGTIVNSRAGYTKSTSNGISVSADFDSDDDDGYQKPLPYGRDTGSTAHNPTEEYQPNEASAAPATPYLFDFQESQGSATQNTNTASNSNTSNVTEEDDDDEFAEFQSATPAASSKKSTGLADLVFSNNTSFSTPQTYTSSTTVTPAVVEASKAVDPFGSLFSSAKNEKYKATPEVKQNGPVVNNAASDTDLFGDLKPAPDSTAAPANNNKSEEIDLLSF
ncbi:unnamed protein product [Kluyveromyces dobzhanskii CBS 2104]|uniref:WGS project CCBQ000000000 data, contig 00016 n=1 Tax=Kluyveromyces dobzhanskii CBS 2104 TaxID=1427455 RepID=A0A0A8L281_9SACH|nr:unnamed protein product [Kluyveromyces dobzhanskii CBS 2104]